MFLSRKHLLIAVLCLASLSLVAQNLPADIHISNSDRVHFIAYGDTRFTDPADTEAANPEVRRELVKAIARAHPDFVTFSGDITYNGNNPNDWKVYDQETAVWREQHIRVFPALGNHDLHGDLMMSLANFFEHYPDLNHSRYYSVNTGNVLLLTLDSSLPETSGAQGNWLMQKIEKLPANFDFVAIVLHHPPYTSSTDEEWFGSERSERAPEQALARFLEERQQKMRARIVVFAGHVHNYERHEHRGVTYFVSGGGGAHPDPIERKPTDLFQSSEINYHYIDVKIESGTMVATMNRLEMKNGVASWTQPDRVTISTPAARHKLTTEARRHGDTQKHLPQMNADKH